MAGGRAGMAELQERVDPAHAKPTIGDGAARNLRGSFVDLACRLPRTGALIRRNLDRISRRPVGPSSVESLPWPRSAVALAPPA